MKTRLRVSNAAEGLSVPADYQARSAADKQDFLWQKRILPTRYDTLPSLEPIDVLGLLLTSLRTKMDERSDEAPPKWHKAIHARGSVAKIRFVPTADSPYTGLFKGAEYGLLRLSLAGEPSDRGFAPGLAVKLFVDGKPSENFSALVSLTGQGENYNFFANEFSNIVPVVNRIGPRLVNLIFSRVTKFPTKLYLQDLAEIDRQGNRENAPYYPEQIFLVPNPQVQFASSPPHDFREDLATIPAGTSLFTVKAVPPETTATQPKNRPKPRQRARIIGQIITTSEFVASSYGDSRLFFRHQRFRDR